MYEEIVQQRDWKETIISISMPEISRNFIFNVRDTNYLWYSIWCIYNPNYIMNYNSPVCVLVLCLLIVGKALRLGSGLTTFRTCISGASSDVSCYQNQLFSSQSLLFWYLGRVNRVQWAQSGRISWCPEGPTNYHLKAAECSNPYKSSLTISVCDGGWLVTCLVSCSAPVCSEDEENCTSAGLFRWDDRPTLSAAA